MKNIMSAIALTFFAANGMNVMTPMQKYEQECPLAYNKLQDTRQMIIQDGYYKVEHRYKVLLPEAYAEFLKECIEEAKKNEKEAMLVEAIAKGMNPEVAKKWVQDPQSISLQQ